ncbi:MAG: Hpt domain-containing protein [Rhodobacteraceae bacterium]|nr:Hpt domain-containing protein [Paracoccaceae bacterium]
MIDWARVEELRNEVGEDAYDEVLELFLEEVDEVMDRLRAAPDPDRLPDDLHFVRGSALNLGLKRFCILCHGLEHQIRRGESVMLDPLLDCYAKSKSALLDPPTAGRSVA